MPIRPGDALGQALDLPYDTLMGYPLLQATGNVCVRLENHKGLRTLSDTLMEFDTPRGPVRFTGRELVIRRLDRDEVTIGGFLDAIDLSGLR